MLRVSEGIFRAFPAAVIGVVAFEGVRNEGESAEILESLQPEEDETERRFAGAAVQDHPHIACWREAYRRFGAKPKDHPSSIENLVRRAARGERLRHVNRLVDLYNAVSLKHLVPVGGEDLDAIEGDVALTFATDQEPPVRLLGEPEARPPKPGEVIYRDRAGAICRRWNWKEADRTKLTEKTKDGFLVIEGLPPVDRARVESALAELAALVQKHCGGSVRTGIVHRENPAMVLREPA
ncbi:MAG: phenylalanine--tRNA ligase beta subunit-related protein [Thermoanaerobaculia bacterium]